MVYVGPCEYPIGKLWKGQKWCHMFADTVEELHAMADQIGMRREWFQGAPKHKLEHYDLNSARRGKAVAAGAVSLTYGEENAKLREFFAKLREQKLQTT